MAALNPLLIQAPVMSYYFVNKDTAQALSAGIVVFYRDSEHSVKKPVYQVTEAPGPIFTYTELSNPLELSSSGVFVDQNGAPILIYLYPYEGSPNDVTPSKNIDLYFIQIYSSGGVLQQTISAFPSGVTIASVEASGDTDNLIANPQFSSVSFNNQSSCAITVTGSPQVSPIAPGWDLVTNGTGTVTVTQVASLLTSIPSQPPYWLNISSTGMSAPLQLRQRFYGSPRLLVGSFVSGYFVVSSLTFVTPVVMSYVPSHGTPASIPIVTINTTADGNWHDTTGLTSTVEIAPTIINPDDAPDGYVDIIITIQPNVQIGISSIQLAAVSALNITEGFLQQPVARETDHLFHYYEPSLLQQPKSTILTGWDFALNPWQFQPTAKTTITVNQYIADQTILVQQAYVASATGSNIASGQATPALNKALQLTAVTATNQFAIIQYIDPTTIAPYWNESLSSLVKASLTTVNNTSCHIKMRLIWRTTVPSTIGQNEPFSSWSAGSDPVLAAGWNYVVPLNDPAYILSSTATAYSFDSMLLPAASAATMTLGIMLYTIDNLSITGTADSIQINSISLVHNDFAVESEPKTFDQVLRECQYYYETSFEPGTASSTGTWAPTTANALFVSQQASYNAGYTGTQNTACPFELKYLAKRTIPQMIFRNTNSTNNSVLAALYYNGSLIGGGTNQVLTTNWGIFYQGKSSINYAPSTTTVFSSNAGVGAGSSAGLFFQYVADARLGLVP